MNRTLMSIFLFTFISACGGLADKQTRENADAARLDADNSSKRLARANHASWILADVELDMLSQNLNRLGNLDVRKPEDCERIGFIKSSTYATSKLIETVSEHWIIDEDLHTEVLTLALRLQVYGGSGMSRACNADMVTGTNQELLRKNIDELKVALSKATQPPK